MQWLFGVLACLALCHAYELDTSIDWSQVKQRDIKAPLPFGAEHVAFSERIIGGQEAQAHSRPYMAALLIFTTEGVLFCGGSLISARDILTSARCLTGATEVFVILGAHNVIVVEPTQQTVYSNVTIIHENWDDHLLLNDIAIVKLVEEVELNEFVSVIPLPTLADVDNDLQGARGVVSGWGSTGPDSEGISNVLNEVDLEILGNWDCNSFYLGAVIGTQMCTSGVGGVGAFGGDVGGPLVVGNKQFGIVSFAVENAWAIEWPTVYTRLTRYLVWLRDNSDANIE